MIRFFQILLGLAVTGGALFALYVIWTLTLIDPDMSYFWMFVIGFLYIAFMGFIFPKQELE